MSANWREKSACATPLNTRLYFKERDIWFHDENDDPELIKSDNKQARSICFTCPVRDLCVREALEEQSIHGFRGGLTEEETRQVLSQDETGKEVRRQEYPFCPMCKADVSQLVPTTVDLPEGGRWSVAKSVECSSCGFYWKSRSSHNALLAFRRDEKKRQEAEEREAQATRGLQKP